MEGLHDVLRREPACATFATILSELQSHSPGYRIFAIDTHPIRGLQSLRNSWSPTSNFAVCIFAHLSLAVFSVLRQCILVRIWGLENFLVAKVESILLVSSDVSINILHLHMELGKFWYPLVSFLVLSIFAPLSLAKDMKSNFDFDVLTSVLSCLHRRLCASFLPYPSTPPHSRSSPQNKFSDHPRRVGQYPSFHPGMCTDSTAQRVLMDDETLIRNDRTETPKILPVSRTFFFTALRHVLPTIVHVSFSFHKYCRGRTI